MLRTYARLEGLLDEGDGPDVGLLIEALPMGVIVLSRHGRVRAFNNLWLERFDLSRNNVRGKKYRRFCDPVLRRHIDRAFGAGEGAMDLSLSARNADGSNVFFQADIVPLGQGWIVCARFRDPDDPRARHVREDRYRLLGRAAAAWLPLLVNPPPAGSPRAVLQPLVDWLANDDAKPEPFSPAALLDTAREVLEPAFAQRGVHLALAVDEPLPDVVGHRAQLLHAVLTVLFQALDAAESGETVTVHAATQVRDVAVTVDFPCRATLTSAEAPAVDPASLSVIVARQILRQHDGDLRHRRAEDGTARFTLHLPARSVKT
jgi:hypothetical protein